MTALRDATAPTLGPAGETIRPPAWAVLEAALITRRPVRARYHGTERLLCPHALGWKGGRPKVLAYQAPGATTTDVAMTVTHQQWRSMFVDEIEDPILTDDQWQTADNYTPRSTGIDTLVIAVS